ncbi:MAG: HAD-IIIC family phosphatase [Acidobacteriota bacterium]
MPDAGKDIKCVVWDLDHTLWDGTLAEHDAITLRPGIGTILRCLDERGILHSIASKNHAEDALAQLERFDIVAYFLYPQIHWGAKSLSISRIGTDLNIGVDAMLFIDDQPFEREEVAAAHPEIRCLDAAQYQVLLSHPALNPRVVTEDARRRRQMYLDDLHRKNAEEAFDGPPEQFLASLEMRFGISAAQAHDLQRAEELTVRTNQLNATGRTYSHEELDRFRTSPHHKLLVCELTDRFGSYGKIGLALIEVSEHAWHIRLLLMSCRVMSRGVGTVLLSYLMQQAKAAGKSLRADFKKTDRNRLMYVTYKFANFYEVGTDGEGMTVLANDLSQIQDFPPFIRVNADEEVEVTP